MNKELLIYSGLYSYTAEQFIRELEANKDKDITLRINTPGGDVMAVYGMIAKFQEHKKGKYIKVDGMAASAGAFFLCYADEVECLDVSEILFHRASYGAWIENNKNYFTDEMKDSLIKVNNNLRAAMESKFTADQWLTVTGVSLDELFSLESRIDVRISAIQAKELGLVNKINSITPEKKAEIEALSMSVAAAAMAIKPNSLNNKNNGTMTIEQLKQDHPEIFAQAVQVGVNNERERVEALAVFASIAPEEVQKAIAEGTAFTAKQMAEFALKTVQANGKPAEQPTTTAAANTGTPKPITTIVAEDNAPAVNTNTATPAATAEENNTDDFMKSVYVMAGIQAS